MESEEEGKCRGKELWGGVEGDKEDVAEDCFDIAGGRG